MRNKLIHADVLEGLRRLGAGTTHCVITSPPYWRLRSYPGVAPTTWADGQTVCLGAEADPESFIRHLVQVFEEVRRVMRDDAVLFVNIGETYNAGSRIGNGTRINNKQATNQGSIDNGDTRANVSALRDGDRCGIPERFALAMQAAGWWWRDTIIWAKKSPMPSSQFGWRWVRCRVKVEAGKFPKWNSELCQETAKPPRLGDGNGDVAKWEPCPGCDKCRDNDGLILRKGRFRTTAAHEPVFMFVKSERYFCDDRACAEESTFGESGRQSKVRGEFNGKGQEPGKEPFRAITETRNPRSVWSLANEPVKEKHFAAYPSKLVKKMVDMATSPHGCCAACGSPYAPIVVSERIPTRPALNPKEWKHDGLDRSQSSPNRDPQRHIQVTRAEGYRATCDCNAGSPAPCVVLDPFAGTGTTARVSYQTGRDYILIEASADYLPIIEKNIQRPLPTKGAKKKQIVSSPGQKDLF